MYIKWANCNYSSCYSGDMLLCLLLFLHIAPLIISWKCLWDQGFFFVFFCFVLHDRQVVYSKEFSILTSFESVAPERSAGLITAHSWLSTLFSNIAPSLHMLDRSFAWDKTRHLAWLPPLQAAAQRARLSVIITFLWKHQRQARGGGRRGEA